eukprot:251135-Chlamydomonas_euryale.AAC.1
MYARRPPALRALRWSHTFLRGTACILREQDKCGVACFSKWSLSEQDADTVLSGWVGGFGGPAFAAAGAAAAAKATAAALPAAAAPPGDGGRRVMQAL